MTMIIMIFSTPLSFLKILNDELNRAFPQLPTPKKHMLEIVELERWWPLMSKTHKGENCGVGSSFSLLVVLFILLIIIGASYIY